MSFCINLLRLLGGLAARIVMPGIALNLLFLIGLCDRRGGETGELLYAGGGVVCGEEGLISAFKLRVLWNVCARSNGRRRGTADCCVGEDDSMPVLADGYMPCGRSDNGGELLIERMNPSCGPDSSK